MRKAFLIGCMGLAALVWTGGCSNSQGTSESPVFITVSIDLQPGFINVAVPAPVQINTITLQSHAKDPTSIDTQGFSDVQINQYTVTFTRTDGGTVVPPPQTFGCGVLVPHDGNASLNNFPVLYAVALQGPPFDALFPYNNGVDRETGKNEIDMKFNITFYGQTVSGKRVQSDTASGLLTFQYSAAAPARAAR
jgi:hypothetical protein